MKSKFPSLIGRLVAEETSSNWSVADVSHVQCSQWNRNWKLWSNLFVSPQSFILFQFSHLILIKNKLLNGIVVWQ